MRTPPRPQLKEEGTAQSKSQESKGERRVVRNNIKLAPESKGTPRKRKRVTDSTTDDQGTEVIPLARRFELRG